MSIRRAMSERSYEYQPLCSGEIRCIRILPSDNDDEDLVLEVRHFNLQFEDTIFDALSYAWGSPTVHHTVSVANDRSYILVRDNCYRFLKHWRRKAPDLSVWIWIDAICIDQTANEEKAQQVRQMSQIYGFARRALIWLGCASEQTIFPDFIRQHPEFLKDRSRYEYEGIPHSLHDVISSTWSLEELETTSPHPAIAHLRQIVSADYWSRRWILQEVSFARSHRFILGNELYSACDMLLIDDLTHCLYDFMPEPKHVVPATNKWVCGVMWEVFLHLEEYSREELCASPCVLHDSSLSFASEHELSQIPDKMALVEALKRFQEQRCGDIRDRIYSLLSFTISGSEFEVDYACSVQQLFMSGLDHAILERSQNVRERGFLTDGDAAILHSTLFRNQRWTFETIPPPPSTLSQTSFSDQLYDVVFQIHVIFEPPTNEENGLWVGHYPDRSCCDKNIDHEQVEFKFPDTSLYNPALSMHEAEAEVDHKTQIWVLTVGGLFIHLLLAVNADYKVCEYFHSSRCHLCFPPTKVGGEGSNFILRRTTEEMTTFLTARLSTVCPYSESDRLTQSGRNQGLKISMSASDITIFFDMIRHGWDE